MKFTLYILFHSRENFWTVLWRVLQTGLRGCDCWRRYSMPVQVPECGAQRFWVVGWRDSWRQTVRTEFLGFGEENVSIQVIVLVQFNTVIIKIYFTLKLHNFQGRKAMNNLTWVPTKGRRRISRRKNAFFSVSMAKKKKNAKEKRNQKRKKESRNLIKSKKNAQKVPRIRNRRENENESGKTSKKRQLKHRNRWILRLLRIRRRQWRKTPANNSKIGIFNRNSPKHPEIWWRKWAMSVWRHMVSIRKGFGINSNTRPKRVDYTIIVLWMLFFVELNKFYVKICWVFFIWNWNGFNVFEIIADTFKLMFVEGRF